MPTPPSRGTLLMTRWKELLAKIFVGALPYLTGDPSHRHRANRWTIPAADFPRRRGDAGMSTAEYAVGTVAAVGFATVLYGVIHSSATRSLLTGLVNRALSVTF